MKSNFDISTIEKKFSKDCCNFTAQNLTYYKSYPEFLKYFNNLKRPITEHDLIIGINFVYGWMPRIFNFRSDNFNEALKILNNAKKGTEPTIEQLEVLIDLLDHSLIGVSKLLHFINPEIFAIWDSRVYCYLFDTNKKPHTAIMNNCKIFKSYLECCKFLTEKNEYEFCHNEICYKVGISLKKGYMMTKFRTAELVMWENGKIIK